MAFGGRILIGLEIPRSKGRGGEISPPTHKTSSIARCSDKDIAKTQDSMAAIPFPLVNVIFPFYLDIPKDFSGDEQEESFGSSWLKNIHENDKTTTVSSNGSNNSDHAKDPYPGID